MATGALGIKLRCASWQQLATIYKRDLSRGTMFLKASNPPPLGTSVRIDLTLPSGSVVVLNGTVAEHQNDPQRGAGVELKLAPIPTGSIWLIESALSSEGKRTGAPVVGSATGPVPSIPPPNPPSPSAGGVVPVNSTGSIPVVKTPVLSDGHEVASAEVDLIRALVAEAESLKKLNPFLVLGLGYEASDADVRAAFGELTKRYHPDRFARYQSTELRGVAAEIFILIRDAYRRLGDEAGRQQVLATLGRPQRTVHVPQVKPPLATPSANQATQPLPAKALPTVTMPPPPPLPPEQTPPTAMPVVRPGGMRAPTDKPVGAIRGAVDQSRGNPVPKPVTPADTIKRPIITQAPAGTSDASDSNALEDLLDEGRVEEALAGYKVMAKKHPTDRTLRAGIELCEGLLAITHRDRLEAAQRFEAALEIDPANERAARELADMRRQATNERKGLLSRLMGKKE